MSKPDSPDCEQPIEVRLTEAEHTLLLNLEMLDLEVEELIAGAEVKGGTVEMLLSPEDLDDLIGSVAFEANHIDDRKLQDQLDELCAKLEEFFV